MSRLIEFNPEDEVVRELLAPFSRVQPVRLRADSTGRRRSPRVRSALVIAAAVAVLAGAGVATAAGFGVFNGLSATQHPQAPTDVLPSQTAGQVQQEGCGAFHESTNGTAVPYACDPGSSRLVSTLPSGDKLYVLADSNNDLCVYLQNHGSWCGNSLSKAQPAMGVSENDSGDFFAYGVAMDGVVSVSFAIEGQDVTVPVRHNVWAYETQSAAWHFSCLTARFADGSTAAVGPCGGSNSFPGPPGAGG